MVKTTKYFDFTKGREDRKIIKQEWIVSAMEHPIHEEIQKDGRIRRWTWVEEESKFLRVIPLEDAKTVHNAFFDRSYKRKKD